MKNIEIYTKKLVDFAEKQKSAYGKNVTYKEIDITNDPQGQEAMVQRTGGKTSVPEIFVDGVLVGGCDDIYALDEKGELDAILGIE